MTQTGLTLVLNPLGPSDVVGLRLSELNPLGPSLDIGSRLSRLRSVVPTRLGNSLSRMSHVELDRSRSSGWLCVLTLIDILLPPSDVTLRRLLVARSEFVVLLVVAVIRIGLGIRLLPRLARTL